MFVLIALYAGGLFLVTGIALQEAEANRGFFGTFFAGLGVWTLAYFFLYFLATIPTG